MQHAGDPGDADPRGDLVAERAQAGGNDPGRPPFVEAEFGVVVQVAAQRDHVVDDVAGDDHRRAHPATVAGNRIGGVAPRSAMSEMRAAMRREEPRGVTSLSWARIAAS